MTNLSTLRVVNTIVTHDGVAHADDATAVAVLLRLFPQAKVLRSRKPADWDKGDALVDVGEKSDGRRYFDHHQWKYTGADANARRRPNGVGYASAGLVWEVFGAEYCRPLAEQHGIDPAVVAVATDAAHVQVIDGIDTRTIVSKHQILGVDGQPMADTFVLQVSGLLSSMMPVATMEDDSPAGFDRAFLEKMVPLAAQLLDRAVVEAAAVPAAAKIVMEADKGDPILLLPRFCRWESKVAELPHVRYVVFQDVSGAWRVRTVPVSLGAKQARKAFPDAWRTLGRDDLVAATVPDIVFVHKEGFIAGTKTKEGALRLAELALLA